MKINSLICKLKQNYGSYIKIDKYIIQIYSNGRRGNVKRKNEAIVCAFDIEEERIMIAPAKEDLPMEFGYTRYAFGKTEEIEKISQISHKDSKEIYEVFINFIHNN